MVAIIPRYWLAMVFIWSGGWGPRRRRPRRGGYRGHYAGHYGRGYGPPRGYGYYRPDPAAIEAAATEARTHLGPDRYDDALDTGRGLPATHAATMLRT